MHTKMEKTNQAVTDHCGLCGRAAELLEFHGKPEKYCVDCCADLAIAVLLTGEIDAATMSGQGQRHGLRICGGKRANSATSAVRSFRFQLMISRK